MAQAPVSLEVSRIQRTMAELFEAIEADAARRPPGEIALEGVIYAAARSQRPLLFSPTDPHRIIEHQERLVRPQ